MDLLRTSEYLSGLEPLVVHIGCLMDFSLTARKVSGWTQGRSAERAQILGDSPVHAGDSLEG